MDSQSFCLFKLLELWNAALLQPLPWSLQGIAVVLSSGEAFQLLLPSCDSLHPWLPLVWSSLCSASPSDVIIQVFASSAPCWHHLGGFQLRSGPELSIKKDRVTHHLVKQPGVGTGTRNIQLLKKMISADGSDPAQLPITADHSSL